MAPLVLLMKWRSSSKDLTPEKSNLTVMIDISLMILDILRVFMSSLWILEVEFCSKSCIIDFSRRAFTLNFSSALEK